MVSFQEAGLAAELIHLLAEEESHQQQSGDVVPTCIHVD